MAALRPDLIKRIREVLRVCAPLNSHELLPLFVDERIAPWEGFIPLHSRNREEFISELLPLVHKESTKGDNAFVSLLQVMADRLHPEDACGPVLRALTEELREALRKPPIERVADKGKPQDSPQPPPKQVTLEAVAGALQLSLVGTPGKWKLEARNIGDVLLRMATVVLRPPATVAVAPNRVTLGSIAQAEHVRINQDLVIRPGSEKFSEVIRLEFEVVYRTPAGPERHRSTFSIPV